MIASNKHGYPSLEPECACDHMIDIPDIYLDLMFRDLPASDGSKRPAMFRANPQSDRAARGSADVASSQKQRAEMTASNDC